MGSRDNSIYGPQFQALRLEALERDQHRCCACNHDGSEYRLEVHHRTYQNDPLQLTDLYTFCVRCHDVWTSLQRGDRYDARVPIQIDDVSPYDSNARPMPRVRANIIAKDEVIERAERPDFARKKIAPRAEDESALDVRFKP